MHVKPSQNGNLGAEVILKFPPDPFISYHFTRTFFVALPSGAAAGSWVQLRWVWASWKAGQKFRGKSSKVSSEVSFCA